MDFSREKKDCTTGVDSVYTCTCMYMYVRTYIHEEKKKQN